MKPLKEDQQPRSTSVVLCCAPGVKPKILSTNEEGARMHATIEVSPRGVEKCFRLTSPKTISCLNWGDLKTELGCFSGEQLDLLFPESVFVVLSPFVNIGLTVLQHAVD